MAELASGAVSSLLTLLKNEALLLSRVGSDVEFIKEEMESMQSFLEHLARTAPPAGGHDEQVRTWMKQVRDLAHDCSNFVDLYLRRGDPAVYRARTGRWHHIWWAFWLVQKTIAQHKAAIRLQELKERARDVGKRRLRYGVDIPPGKDVGPSLAATSSSPSRAAAVVATAEDGDEEEEEDEGDRNQVAADIVSDPSRALEPHVLEEYCAEQLDRWLQKQAGANDMPSIAIVAPDDAEDAGAIARESALTLAASNFTCEVWVNLSELHLPWDLPLLSSEIMSYILRQCEQRQGKAEEGDAPLARQAYRYKDDLEEEIRDMVDDGDIDDKIEEIKSKIEQVDVKIGGGGGAESSKKLADEECKSPRILLRALQLMQNAPDIGVPLSFEDTMEEAASRLKDVIEMKVGESEDSGPKIRLDYAQYNDVLLKVFPFQTSKPPQPQAQEAGATTSAAATSLGEDHIKEILHNHKITLDIICKLLPKHQPEGNSATATATGTKQQGAAAAAAAASSAKESKEKKKDVSGEVLQTSSAIAAAIKEANDRVKEITGEVKARSSAISAATIDDTKEKMDKISMGIQDKMLIKGIVNKIKPHLEHKKTLIILQDDEDYVSTTEDDEDNEPVWKETRNALNLIGCAPGSAVIVSTKKSQKSKEFCYPSGEPITCSLVGLYHDIVLHLTRQQVKSNGIDGHNSKILRRILDKCHPHEFCMKIFADALYANPKRSYEDLQKLHGDLSTQTTFGGKAKKVLSFSYKDLPREYKTCLLYLAIFPQGHGIKRSTLTGRWVTEGLITRQDWRTAVLHAERCFEALIKRGFVLPREVGDAGKVKSCMVGDQAHGFITKIANKEHILDARLSDLWARHFSIFSGLRLRTSDSIGKFVHKLPKYSSQLPLLKVLDLEGTDCFEKNHYLRDICNKIILLKYLSLRRTNVSHLPGEINNLHELEVLDIRQTMVPEHATRHVLLLKLRRFLAHRIDPRLGDNSRRFPVQIPTSIEMMENLEVLSNVRASRTGNELRDIRHLWQLRKLGVVIQDKKEHLDNLLRAVGDLKDCLQSLSVTISDTRSKRRTPSSKDERLKEGRQPPKHLESLTINGNTERVQLLELLAKGSEELADVTLSGTMLGQEHLVGALAVLPKLHCLRLRHGAYSDSKLTFNKEEFSHLKYFIVEGSTNMNETEIKFQDGATAELEKIVLSFTNIRCLGGIDNLPKLKELEFKGNQLLHSISEEEAAPGQSTNQRTALEQNTESRVAEQNTKQNTEIRAVEQNTQGSAPELNTQDGTPEQNTESRATEPTVQRQTPEQNTESRPPEESRFTFKKEKFKSLKYFRVEHSKVTKIIFEDGAAPELKKIALSLTNKQSQIIGVSGLAKLKEIELRGDKFLLSLFEDAKRIAKVTLCETQLKQADIQVLANKTSLRCLVLSDKSYDEGKLAFDKVEFPKLELLVVECQKVNSISFANGSAPMLKKIVWSFTEMKSIIGINNLLKLVEVEFVGDPVPHQVRKDIAAHVGRPVLTHKKQ
ncbi:hypothetical protein BS78_08G090300 [Paspalum vaginatum]|nr:hypothetical protein BS78_08G090300 [Paspalum vaginatum]